MPGPDFRLDGYRAANAVAAEQFCRHITDNEIDLRVLAQHHTHDEQHSYFVLHDGSATWGTPDEPQIVALHLRRDTRSRTFRFQHATLPLPAMAQSWLIARGCPKNAVRLSPGTGSTPADEATKALEERLLDDGDRFALLTSYTDDSSTKPQTIVLLRAVAEHTAFPFRVLLEEADLLSGTHTLREGAFTDLGAVSDWWDQHRSGGVMPLLPPLPPADLLRSPGLPPRPAPPTRPSAHGR
ncbi:hypothetical protein [Streptomyces sp. AK02-01A]|uniref:hypothetical protein n=1 Tax=Streptomyces sp. AK02-01A TaxID=3028648 RepID=UPI0029BDC870|nr:hypothetical protein [Streptomyces sp. AK02-01A]MDX3854912.1 hypothetical protein [Streptomyces sp. AK02-01A]